MIVSIASAVIDIVADYTNRTRGVACIGIKSLHGPIHLTDGRDRSPVGNGCGAEFPKPLQGLDGVCFRVSRGFARSSQLRPRSCRGVKSGAVCGGGGHSLFDEAKNWMFFSCSTALWFILYALV